jgi:ATP-dependent DNA helicase PIF1
MTQTISYYIHSGSSWASEEDARLREEYERGLSILEIGIIHKRTPGGISARLKVLELITSTQKVNGYAEYKKSELYKEIMEKEGIRKKAAAERKLEKTSKLFPGIGSAGSTEDSESAGTAESAESVGKPVQSSLRATLNEEQLNALTHILEGKSIFVTGPGGSGKSYLLEALQEEFRLLGKVLAITALTGCAALLLGSKAKTLHSWAGIGLGKGDINAIISSIVMNGRKKKAWIKTDCLVIDEVSMMTPQLLQMLDAVGRRVRKCSTEPFGGLQVVFVGDFYQLPPVSNDKSPFAFQSPLWNQVVKETISLKTIYRQSDEVFQKVLGEARTGTLSQESIEILKGRMNLPWKKELIRPTLLFTRNADVGEINHSHFAKLGGEAKVYKVRTVQPSEAAPGTLDGFLKTSRQTVQPSEATPGTLDEFLKTSTQIAPGLITQELAWAIERLDRDAPYEKELTLKVDAQVMLVVNLNQEAGLINGSRGIVKSFDKEGNPVVLFASNNIMLPVKPHVWKIEGDTNLGREQIPLRLAYALTIHKAQGASLDSAFIDIGSSTFEYGQAYVALSRVRNLNSLFVYEFDPKAFRVHPAVNDFYNGLCAK